MTIEQGLWAELENAREALAETAKLPRDYPRRAAIVALANEGARQAASAWVEHVTRP